MHILLQMSDAARDALIEFADNNKPNWKSKLRDVWIKAAEPGLLQYLRNASYFGPDGLNKITHGQLQLVRDAKVMGMTEAQIELALRIGIAGPMGLRLLEKNTRGYSAQVLDKCNTWHQVTVATTQPA